MLSPAPPRMSPIPGMSVEEQGDGEKRDFKPWELQESGHRLDNVFSWKVSKSPRLSEAEKAERRRLRKELEAGQTDGAKAKAVGEAEEGAGKEDQSKKGKIPETVRKMLLRKQRSSKNGAAQNGVKGSTTVEQKRSRVAREMPSEVAVKRKSMKEAEKKEKAAEKKEKAAEKRRKATELMMSTLVEELVSNLVESVEMRLKLEQMLDQAQKKEEKSVSRLDRSGWAKNPVPNYGGSPESANDQPARQPGAEIFKYEHPNTSYTVDLVVTSTGAVQCPGCGEEKKQLVRHMKTDKKCSIKFEGRMDFESFDKQLKSFRHRKAEQKRKAQRKAENEEEFMEKDRQQQSKRKAKRKAENEEEFMEKDRQQQSKQKAKKRKIDEEAFMRRNRQEKKKSRIRTNERQRGEAGRARKFRRAIMLGDIFVCSSCERELFEQNVTKIDGLEEKVEKKKPGLFQRCIPRLKPEAELTLVIDGKKTVHHYICHACKGHMQKGKKPPMCAENGLRKTAIVDEEMKLTELERNMISRRILFQKVMLKPKTRWTELQDKVINIPVAPESVTNTLTMLPKTPDEAGLIEVTFKRKLEYKNSHIRGQLVDPRKLYKMLDHLKASGNPYYQFYDDINQFSERLEEERRLHISMQNEGEEEIVDLEDQKNAQKDESQKKASKEKSQKNAQNEESQKNAQNEESPKNDESEDDEEEEREYREKDVVKKHQADVYGKSFMLADNYPEMEHGDEYNAVTVAPGEGEKPRNVLLDKDWDVQAFADLNSPDGRYGLHEKREVRLTDQNFFVQTICNMEKKFAKTPSYVYGAAAYIELKQIMRNLGMQGRHGKEVIGEDGKRTLHMEDAFCVLDNVKQTPRYWRKKRFEMYADLDNLGGFQCFWTLSCADLRWEETISKALRDEGLELRYSTEGFEDEEEVEGIGGHVEVKSEVSGVWMSLKKYLEQDANKSRHEYIRENVLSLTRGFNQRVKAFIKEIVMAKDSPMCVYKYSYKTEFQNRGAAHVHGVLWVNMKKLERKPVFKGLGEAYTHFRQEENVTDEDIDVMARFVDAMSTVSLCAAEVGEQVVKTAKETQNHHHTKKACRKNGGSGCRFGKPHFPSDRTLIAVPRRMWAVHKGMHSDDLVMDYLENEEGEMSDDNEKDNPDKLPKSELLHRRFEKVLKKVKAVLEDEQALAAIWEKVPSKGDTVEEYEQNRRLRIKEMLAMAEVDEVLYYGALQHSNRGVVIVQKRDLDEIMIESYNAEWLKEWNGNISLLICGDFFGVITYVTEYYSKDETKTMQAIKDMLKNRPDENTKEKMKAIANEFMRRRQIGESEGFYKLLPDLLLTNSNITKVWLSLENPKEKVKRMRRAEEDVKEANEIYKKIDGAEGLWSEQPDLMSKWYRRENAVSEEEQEMYADAGDVSLAQFAKMFTGSKSGDDKQRDEYEGQNNQHADIYPEDEATVVEENDDRPDAHFHYLMWGGGEDEEVKGQLLLPNVIKIKDPLPGELPFMRKRRSPAVLRFMKNKRDQGNPTKFFLQEMALYDPDACEAMYNLTDEELLDRYQNRQEKILRVKSQVMEHLQDVEQARQYVEAADKLDLEKTAAELDAAIQQEEDELEGGEVEHPDYQHLDPGQEEQQRSVSIYRKIDVPDIKELKKSTMDLDPWQRRVVDTAIKYAKDLRKAENPVNRRPAPPHLMVHGGAGSGKTTVIRNLCSWVEKIMRRDGDESGLPYVIRCAPTGAAASLIEGMTLHTAFGFAFSGKFTSLDDRRKDLRREQLRKLVLIIIDEVSMMKVEQLYQLCLRMQEVTGRSRVPFGGVCVMCFGDLLQLQPVRGRYIFERPADQSYQVTFEVASRWEMLKVVNLEVNHRQGGDKTYADLLLRLRTNSQTEEDMRLLRARVFKRGHSIYREIATTIVCTKKTAKSINDRELAKLKGDEEMFKARHSHHLQAEFKPPIDEVGEVGPTQYMDELKLKKGCPVMLLQNVDVADCLSNGQLGTYVDTVKGANGMVKVMMVKFKHPKAGQNWRERNPGILHV